MNIEDFLPELFGEKRVYYCQRCLNHGLREKRKNHKSNCLYRSCQCQDCIMVERRRELNCRLMQIEGASSVTSSGSEHSNENLQPTSSSTDSPMEDEKDDGKPKERRPNCQRCAQHNVVHRLKGHKRICPFRDCYCPKCQVVVERQKLMADQIKLRRRQKREKNQIVKSVHLPNAPMIPSPPTAVEPVCMKCTQQVMGFQQLLSLFEPNSVADPMLTLSAVLAACPHRNEPSS